MEVKLKVLSGKNAGLDIPIAGPRFVIGRDEGCQLRSKSDQIGPRHCEIAIEALGITVRDLGSPVGTLVNGTLVSGEQKLAAGDKLTVGPLEFEVSIKAGLGGKKRPKVHDVAEAAARAAQTDTAATDDKDISDWLVKQDADQAAVPRPRKPLYYRPDEDVAAASGSTSGSGETPPEQPKIDSRQAAADVLNKFFKRR